MQSPQVIATRTLMMLIVVSGLVAGNLGCSIIFQDTDASRQVIRNWLVLRPIPVSAPGDQTPDETAQKAAFARDWLASESGETGIQPRSGLKLDIDGRCLKWKTLRSKSDVVDLQDPRHPVEYAVAYAWAEIDQPEERKAFLGIGSDDAVKVWLNGRLVHENWAGRGVRLDDDLVPVELEPGKNRLLLKVQNGVGAWGLACRLMSEDEGKAVQAINGHIQATAIGDEAGIRAGCYAATEEESRRVEAAAALYASIAGLRRAFDDAYGRDRLVRLGFRCITPGLKLPPCPNFRMNGNRASLSPRGWSEIPLIKVDDEWKEFVTPWPETISHAAAHGVRLLPLERTLANTQAMSQVLDGLASEVRAGRYLSAADAYGVLNARLHGLASITAPMMLARSVDLTRPSTRPAACPVPIIELRGDAVAIGKSYGSQERDEIRLLKRDYLDRLIAPYDSWFTFGLGRQIVLARAAQFKPLIRPEHLEEIRAASAAAGIGFREGLLAQCFLDMQSGFACSTIALPASASSDGVARFGRNLDFPSLGILDHHSILLVVHPNDRYAFASITWPGLAGVLSGMNEHGLTVACMEVRRPSRKPDAMPYMLLYRTVLEQCRTVNEAVVLLETTPRQTANNLMLMDASGDRALAEITPEKVTVRRAPDTAALVSTNHHRIGDLDTPGRCNRFDYLHDAARRQFGRLSEADVEEMLSGASQGNMTLQSMIFEPSNRVLYLAVGAGAPNHGFARIDLKPYFR